MIGITLDKVKGSFDASTILWPTKAFVKTLLHKFGGYVRQTQRNSMKRSKIGPLGGPIPSLPGQPPRRRPGKNPDIKETVFYYADPVRKDVVIGMVLLRNKSAMGEPMPGVLEYGGTSIIRTGRWSKKTGNAGRGMKAITVAPRPSAVPAFKKAVKKYLQDLIREGIMPHADKAPTISRSGQVF